MCPDESQEPDSRDLKISEQQRYFIEGELPMPLYNMVWHNVPADQLSQEQQAGAKRSDAQLDQMREEAKRSEISDQWLWFEASPFEVGSEEIGAWCPTYAFGRRFDKGRSTEKQPELQLTVLNGLFASAFTATLFQYIMEVKPVLQMLGTAIFGRIDSLLGTYKDDLLKLHPIPPATIPNFAKNLGSALRENAPQELNDADTIGLLDAGAFCNIPYFPLFRRACDIIIAFDASADSQELWFERAQKYAAARELSGYPRIVYPGKAPAEAQKQAQSASANETSEKKTDANEATEEKLQSASKIPAPHEDNKEEPAMGRCAIWIGSTDDQPCRVDEPSVEDVLQRDGMALVYFPLTGDERLPNPEEVWSTWRFEYTPEETNSMLDLASRNYSSADKRLRTLLRGTWQRKHRDRLANGHLSS